MCDSDVWLAPRPRGRNAVTTPRNAAVSTNNSIEVMKRIMCIVLANCCIATQNTMICDTSARMPPTRMVR